MPTRRGKWKNIVDRASAVTYPSQAGRDAALR